MVLPDSAPTTATHNCLKKTNTVTATWFPSTMVLTTSKSVPSSSAISKTVNSTLLDRPTNFLTQSGSLPTLLILRLPELIQALSQEILRNSPLTFATGAT